MKINSLKVDGFGAWSRLRLEQLSGDITVFCGPNEAGKTTLLQFIRSMLYGFSPERRRYLPPAHGGRPGGSLELGGPDGAFHLDRHDDDRTPDGQARAVLSAADGTRFGEQHLKTLLSNVDEPIFNNVFAVGLREMQALGTLSDTEAAALLFGLSVGLDRVSLVDVLRELEISRNRLLDKEGRPGVLTRLLDERAKLRAEVESLDGLTAQYVRLAERLAALDVEVARLEDDQRRWKHDSRTLEIAVSVRQAWQQRAGLDAELNALRVPEGMSGDLLARFERLSTRLTWHHKKVVALGKRRRRAKAQAGEVSVNEALWRQSARIEAVREQQGWIETLRQRTSQLETEIAQLDRQSHELRHSLGLDDRESFDPASLSPKKMASLRRPAKALRKCREEAADARSRVDAARQAADELAEQIRQPLAARGETELAGPLDRASGLVNQLRRRALLDERLDQMRRYHVELDRQCRSLLNRQLLPGWVLVGLGLFFVLGVVLLMAGLFMPESISGSLGWPMAGMGLVGALMAGATKMLLERSNARQLDSCQKQVNMLQLQVQEATQERDRLDAALPSGGSPVGQRLAEAEKTLAGFEELVPLQTRLANARQEVETRQAAADRAGEEHSAARRRWREALAQAGLPDRLAPPQVRRLLQQADRVAALSRQTDRCREELTQRQGELDGLTDRITQLAADSGVAVNSGNPIEVLRRLVEEAQRQQAQVQRIHELREDARRLRRRQMKCQAAIDRWKRRRRDLFAQLGARNEAEFRGHARQAARADELRRQRETLQVTIDAARGEHCTEEALAQCLDDRDEAELESRWADLDSRLAALAEQVKLRLEERGRLSEQLRALAEDRRPAAKRMELAAVEHRLAETARRWQVLALTRRMLDDIKRIYEKERQPETLQEASGYLRRLTNGRYVRVWTPLGEDVLKVDDSRGESRPVEMLSRGTREQLFLALRFALTAAYAKRGAVLPLVLDDVLVNFDMPRAEAAAELMRDFARAGHQLLVFTCHEHIHKLFRALKVDVRRLPERNEHGAVSSPSLPSLPSPAAREERPKKKRAERVSPADRSSSERPSPERPSRRRRAEELPPWEEEEDDSPWSEAIEAEEDGELEDSDVEAIDDEVDDGELDSDEAARDLDDDDWTPDDFDPEERDEEEDEEPKPRRGRGAKAKKRRRKGRRKNKKKTWSNGEEDLADWPNDSTSDPSDQDDLDSADAA